LVCRSHASLSSEPHPVLSPLSPTQSSRGECTMTMWFPTSCSTGDPPHVASVFGALRHHLRPPVYKCHLVCLSFIPPLDRE
jgi:hypothetical protein